MENKQLPEIIIGGAGLFGSICAQELAQAGFKVKVFEKRDHIGGNCYTEKKDGIDIHKYGPHIFHTSNEIVWSYINRFTTFNNFRLSPIANYKGELYSLPFNMWTFQKMWGVTTPEQAMEIMKGFGSGTDEAQNFEERAISKVGKEIYEKLIYGYTYKQWGIDPKELPASIINRLPVRLTYDTNYFNDKYQGIPTDGYTEIFKKLLNHENITVKLNSDIMKVIEKPVYNHGLITGKYKLIYTGPIDRFFDYEYGHLDYKSSRFEHQLNNNPNFQGCAVMNYTDLETPHTRIIEHKHFTPERRTDKTWVTTEYPDHSDNPNKEPMYPVNDEKNNEVYRKYLYFANNMYTKGNVYFGGRLAEYKYYDMDDTILSALLLSAQIIKKINP